ncbi:MAG: hypothetical protein U1F71_01210 [Verrucomicrobiaceae bacterium]
MPPGQFISGKDATALMMAARYGSEISSKISEYLTNAANEQVREVASVLLDSKDASEVSEKSRDMAKKLQQQTR